MTNILKETNLAWISLFLYRYALAALFCETVSCLNNL